MTGDIGRPRKRKRLPTLATRQESQPGSLRFRKPLLTGSAAFLRHDDKFKRREILSHMLMEFGY